ncbi:Twin-arginine translocation protein TatC [hydrothermal vent metagenome]|uniref:Twin-arginine translocation protein TatC n=1 Tax=hydrothermal vent metagenome TaxID=652676 RepID=A0A3B0YMP8_9ZZZZ
MSSTVDNKEDTEKDQGFVSHLLELRDRLIRVVLVVLVIFGIAFTFWKEIYNYLEAMVRVLDGSGAINFQILKPAGGFFTAVRLSMATAFFIAMPYIFFQLWGFVAPGLYSHERKLVVPILFGGMALFYSGILFARYVVLPIFYSFAETFVPGNTTTNYDIMYYLDFNIKMFFAFGLAFQVPIVTIVLVWGGISTPESLRQKRPYVIVGAFVVGMLLTPPDVVSQVLLAIPMWLLYEGGILISQAYYKPNKDDDDNDNDDDDDSPSGGPSGSTDNSPSKGGPGPGSASAASMAADAFVDDEEIRNENIDKDKDSDGLSSDKEDAFVEESLVMSSESEGGMDYPYDYKPLEEDELDAELDRFDQEMDALEAQQANESDTPEPGSSEPDNSEPDTKITDTKKPDTHEPMQGVANKNTSANEVPVDADSDVSQSETNNKSKNDGDNNK